MAVTDELYDTYLSGRGLTPQRHRLHATVERLRRLADTLLLVDAEAADPGELEALATAVDAAAGRARALPDLSAHETPARAPLPASILTERSPVSGRANVAASPLRLSYGRERTSAEAVYTEMHEGPAGGVHGGVVAASFDELLGVTQVAAGAAGYTATLEVRYRRVTPLHTPIRYEAWVQSREGRRILVHGRSYDDGELLAEATGLFIAKGDLPTSYPE